MSDKITVRGLDDEQLMNLANDTAKTESSFNKKVINRYGYAGKYQFGAEALATVGLIDIAKYKEAKKTGKNQIEIMNDPSNWTIQGGLQSYLNDESIQDKAFIDLARSNVEQGFSSGAINSNSTPADVAAYVKVSHLLGADAATKFFKNGVDGNDVNGTKASTYANQARKAVSGNNDLSITGTTIDTTSGSKFKTSKVETNATSFTQQTLENLTKSYEKSKDDAKMLRAQLFFTKNPVVQPKVFQIDDFTGASRTGSSELKTETAGKQAAMQRENDADVIENSFLPGMKTVGAYFSNRAQIYDASGADTNINQLNPIYRAANAGIGLAAMEAGEDITWGDYAKGIINGRSNWEGRDQEWMKNTMVKEAKIKHYEDVWGPMDEQMKERINESRNEAEADRYVNAAYVQRTSDKIINESGFITKIAAGMVAAFSSPQEGIVNAMSAGVGGVGAGALARLSATSRIGAFAAKNPKITASIIEGGVQGVAVGIVQNSADSARTVSDILYDGALGIGGVIALHGAARGLGASIDAAGLNVKAGAKQFLEESGMISKQQDEALNAQKQIAVDAKISLSDRVKQLTDQGMSEEEAVNKATVEAMTPPDIANKDFEQVGVNEQSNAEFKSQMETLDKSSEVKNELETKRKSLEREIETKDQNIEKNKDAQLDADTDNFNIAVKKSLDDIQTAENKVNSTRQELDNFVSKSKSEADSVREKLNEQVSNKQETIQNNINKTTSDIEALQNKKLLNKSEIDNISNNIDNDLNVEKQKIDQNISKQTENLQKKVDKDIVTHKNLNSSLKKAKEIKEKLSKGIKVKGNHKNIDQRIKNLQNQIDKKNNVIKKNNNKLNSFKKGSSDLHIKSNKTLTDLKNAKINKINSLKENDLKIDNEILEKTKQLEKLSDEFNSIKEGSYDAQVKANEKLSELEYKHNDKFNELNDKLFKENLNVAKKKADHEKLVNSKPDMKSTVDKLTAKNYKDQSRQTLVDQLESIQDQLSKLEVEEIVKKLGVEEFMASGSNNISEALRLKYVKDQSVKNYEKAMAHEGEFAKTQRGRYINALLKKIDKIVQIAPTAKLLMTSESVLLKNIARLITEDPSGVHGGTTASMEFSMKIGEYTNKTISLNHAAFDSFTSDMSSAVKYSSSDVRKQYSRFVDAIIKFKLKGVSEDELVKFGNGKYSEEMKNLTDEIISSYTKIAKDDAVSKGLNPDLVKITSIPRAFSAEKLTNVMSNFRNRNAVSKGFVENVMKNQDQAIKEGKIKPEEAMSLDEVEFEVGKWLESILKSTDSSQLGFISLKDGRFDFGKAIRTSHDMLELETQSPNYKKIQKLYSSELSGQVDMNIKIKLEDGTVIGIEDLMTNDPAGDLAKFARYQSGRIALARRGIDIENPSHLKEIRQVAKMQNATDQEIQALDSVIAQLTGRRFGKNSNPNKVAELFTSITRNIMLTGLVFAQMAETGNMLNHLGWSRGAKFAMDIVSGRLSRQAKKIARGEKLEGNILEDLESFTGQIATENYRYANLYDQYDSIGGLETELSYENVTFMDRAIKASKSFEQFQGMITGFRHVNATQRRFTVEMNLRDVADTVKKYQETGKIKYSKGLKSAGITDDMIKRLAKEPEAFKWENGKFMGTDLSSIGNEKLRLDFTASMRRSVGQVIQEQFIGESGLWAHDNNRKLLYMFRGYMFNSINKQLVRQFGDYGITHGMANMVTGMAFAGYIQYLRMIASSQSLPDEEKEKTLKKKSTLTEFMLGGLAYSSMTGSLQEFFNIGGLVTNYWDSTTRLGPQSGWQDIFPAFSMGNKMYRGALSTLRLGADAAIGNDLANKAERVRDIKAITPAFNNVLVKYAVNKGFANDWEEEETARSKEARARDREENPEKYEE